MTPEEQMKMLLEWSSSQPKRWLRPRDLPDDVPVTRYVCTDRGQHPAASLGAWSQYLADDESLHTPTEDRTQGTYPLVELHGPGTDRLPDDTDRLTVVYMGRRGAGVEFRCPRCGRHPRIPVAKLDAALTAGLAVVDISRI